MLEVLNLSNLTHDAPQSILKSTNISKAPLSPFFHSLHTLGFLTPLVENAIQDSFDQVIHHLFFDQLYGFWQSEYFPPNF